MTKILRVGTDCSGIEAPIEALIQLKIPFKHVFSSEIDQNCIKTIKANYSPEILFGDPSGKFPIGDITKRNLKDVPNIDLYICGFPCQPFSIAGQRKGFKDRRSQVFFSCIDLIIEKKPKYFILENVKGILGLNKGKIWNIIEDELDYLHDEIGYNIDYDILNTRDYGIPQNRERIFIVGTLAKKQFEFPKPIKMKNIRDFVDWDLTEKETTKVKINNKKIPKKSVFIDLNFINQTHFPNSDKWSSTLNTHAGLWVVPLHRRATVEEHLKLQGFRPNKFNVVVTRTEAIKQIGNSMSVNVLKAIYKNLISN